MSTDIRRTILAACAVALAAAAPAAAAPNRSKSLSKTQTTAAWESEAQTSISGQFWWTGSDPAGDCGTFDMTGAPTPAIDYCDQTLVTLDDAGTLDVTLPEAGDGDINDWDLYVYASDGDGTPGDELGHSEQVGGSESVSFDAEPGAYLVVAVPYQSVNSTYTGALTFTPAPEE
jgi:hypothetical protein